VKFNTQTVTRAFEDDDDKPRNRRQAKFSFGGWRR